MRKRFPILLVLVATLLLVAPAWASDAEAPEGAEPPLLDIDLATALVSIVTFLVLLFLLTKLAWKPILNGLQQREDAIRKAVDDAQKASDEARALADQYKAKLDEATDEARAIADEAKRNAEAIRVRIEADARKTADETVTRSKREIEQAKQTAIDEILTEVTSIASEAASRIVRKNLTPEDNAALVDDVVKEFTSSRGGSRG